MVNGVLSRTGQAGVVRTAACRWVSAVAASDEVWRITEPLFEEFRSPRRAGQRPRVDPEQARRRQGLDTHVGRPAHQDRDPQHVTGPRVPDRDLPTFQRVMWTRIKSRTTSIAIGPEPAGRSWCPPDSRRVLPLTATSQQLPAAASPGSCVPALLPRPGQPPSTARRGQKARTSISSSRQSNPDHAGGRR